MEEKEYPPLYLVKGRDENGNLIMEECSNKKDRHSFFLKLDEQTPQERD